MQLLQNLAATIFQPPSSLPRVSAGPSLITTVLHLVFGIGGAVAVLLVTMGGIQYTLSQGDPQKIAKAKNTIIYAVVGLVVAMMGYGIVTFIVGKLG